jgi:two-component system LytT family response regulator
MTLKKYSAVIIDDERDARDMISIFLKESFPSIQVAAEFDSSKKAIKELPALQPDILFLDVEMPGGTGFDVLQQLSLDGCYVIFVTAYAQYAIKAIKARAFDYILKPVDKYDFKQAVNRAIEKLSRKNIENKVLELALKNTGVRKIGIPVLQGIKFVETDTIIYCEADDNYTTLFFTDNTKTVVSKPLIHFEKELKPSGFFRIHNKYLVAIKHISAFTRGKDGGMVTLSNQKKLKVSQSRKAELLKTLSI